MNWKILARSVLQSIFVCMVIAAVVVLYYVCLMINHLQVMGVIGSLIFFAITWEFYFLHMKNEAREIEEQSVVHQECECRDEHRSR